ncbi:MAG: metalloprotease TldD, partial [Deltaproteobacteria bacterium]|nr:metalloprotease TldD [Deltaproteobacteria bacterium]
MTENRYGAPFAPGGPTAIDAQIAQKLLATALSKGGDYADLFFEYEVGGSYSFDEGILKAAGRAVTMGLGVRVMKGDATGYAYVEELTMEAMEGAAKTAAQIADGGGAPAPVGLAARDIGSRYSADSLSLDVPGKDKRDLLERADKAARAADSRVVRVDASFHEQIREILIATSDGKMVRDRQPMLRFGVRAIVEEGDKRQSGSSGGGGRFGMEYFEAKTPEWHADEAVRQAVAMLDAREAPAGEFPV